jgi:4-amino-4-deoxy-L-arabinose transferase-like glycosyltransferase
MQRTRARRALPWLLALLLLGGGLRVAAAVWSFPVELRGDEVYYVEVAASIARGQGHRFPEQSGTTTRALRPPGHAFVLAGAIGRVASPVEARSLGRAVALEVLIGTLLVFATAWLGRELFDARTGWLAGAVAAVYPTAVAQSHFLWSENLFALLLVSALACAVRARRASRPGLIVGAGALFGVATLTREVALPVAGVVALWWVWTADPGDRRSAGLRGALLLGVTLLVIAPWSLRNAAVLGRVVPVATVGWFATAEGNALEHPDWMRLRGPRSRRFKVDYQLTPGELARSDFARQRALEMIRDEQPTWLPKKLIRNMGSMWSPDTVLFYKVRHGAYGKSAHPVLRPLVAASVAFYVLVFAGGVLGISQARDGGRRSLAMGVLAAACAIHVFANAIPRFRTPWMPLLIVYASFAAVHWRNFRLRPSYPALVTALFVLAFFFAVCVGHYHEDVAKTWSWGRPAPH